MVSQLKPAIHNLINGNYRVFILIVISAVILTVLRILSPLEISWDQASQIGATYRFLQGLGLTETDCATHPFNINQLPTSLYLTNFPPGFSLLVAGLLVLGIPLITSLKILYTIVTLVGWFNWGIIGSYLLSGSTRSGFLPIKFIIATLLPFLYTPLWNGTDIILWAGVPGLIILLFYSETQSHYSKLYIILAGILFGFLYSIRYATLFLVIFVFFMFLKRCFKQPLPYKSLLTDFLLFIASSLPFFLCVSLYNSLSKNSAGALPKTFDLSALESITEPLVRILNNAPTLSVLFGIPTIFYQPIGLFINRLKEQSLFLNVYGFLCLVFFLILVPLAIIKFEQSSSDEPKKKFIISLSLLISSMALFLVVAMFTTKQWAYLGDTRQYVPTGPSGLLIFYGLATLQANARSLNQFKKIIIYIGVFLFSVFGVFLASNIRYESGLVFLGRKISPMMLARPFLGWGFYSLKALPATIVYPSNQILIRFSDTATALRQLQKENPDAVFYIASAFRLYVYDGNPKFRCLPGRDFWKQAFTDKPVRVFWVVNDSCPGRCIADENGEDVIEKLSRQPGLLKTVATFSREETKILVSDLPTGYKFLDE